MGWIVAIYFVVGVFKAFAKLGADVPHQPIWMYSEKNPLVWCLYFTFYVLLWPFAKG